MNEFYDNGKLYVKGIEKLPDGVYVPYFSIKFPSISGLDIEGILIFGLRDESGSIWCIGEWTFSDSDELVEIFDEIWLTYHCRRVFYYDEKDIGRIFRIGLSRNLMLDPRPTFRRIRSFSYSSSLQKLRAGKLKYKGSGMIQRSLHKYDITGEPDNIMECLGVLCHGFSKIK